MKNLLPTIRRLEQLAQVTPATSLKIYSTTSATEREEYVQWLRRQAPFGSSFIVPAGQVDNSNTLL
jgi:hypothetical protein